MNAADVMKRLGIKPEDRVHLLIRHLKRVMVERKPTFAMIIDDLFDIPAVEAALRGFERECKGYMR